MERSGNRVSLEDKGGGKRGRVLMYLQGRQASWSRPAARGLIFIFVIYKSVIRNEITKIRSSTCFTIHLSI